jgi:hypothetical protein
LFDNLYLGWAEHVAQIGDKKNAHHILVGKPDGKRKLVRHNRRWNNTIKMDLKNKAEGVKRIHLA